MDSYVRGIPRPQCTVPFQPIIRVTDHIQKKTFLYFIHLKSKEILSAISGDFFFSKNREQLVETIQ